MQQSLQYELRAPQAINGRILLPASKSISNRVLAMGLLSGRGSSGAETGLYVPQNVSDCDDVRAMLGWMRPYFDQPAASGERLVDIGAAGTAMRFSTALLAVLSGQWVITGSQRMKQRPIGVLVDALRTLGADIRYAENDGFPPLRINGNPNLRGGDISLRGDVSSQFVSALLMIGPVLAEGLRLTLTTDVISRPYIDMTLSLMRQFGADAQWVDAKTISVAPTGYQRRPFTVESDWSASSYWYELVALAPDEQSSVELPALFAESLQGDSAVERIFRVFGVQTEYLDGGGVRISRATKPVTQLSLNMLEVPDLAQTVAVCSCMLGVPFCLSGLQSLRIKETDRLAALSAELSKLGCVLRVEDNSRLLWDGERTAPQTQPAIDTYEDHRMAMAFAPAALRVPGLRINQPQVVSKSYPRFWDDLRQVGFQISETDF